MAIITLPDNFFEKEKPEGLEHGLFYKEDALGEWQKIEGLMEAELTTESVADPFDEVIKVPTDDRWWEYTFTITYNLWDAVLNTCPKISRKKFKKIMMSLGFSRNVSEQFCKTCIGNGYDQFKSYKEAYVLSGLIFMNGGRI